MDSGQMVMYSLEIYCDSFHHYNKTGKVVCLADQPIMFVTLPKLKVGCLSGLDAALKVNLTYKNNPM